MFIRTNRIRTALRRVVVNLIALSVFLAIRPALAASHIGTVAMLEVWPSGNVAFTLSVTVPTCNQQFVLNVSSLGTKNLYAALLAAKTSGRQVRVDTSACGPAEGYGENYNVVSYLYVLE